MNIAIDIGNTRTKLGVFEEGKLIKKTISEKWDLKHLKLFLQKYDIRQVILSSVANIDQTIEDYLQEHYFYRRLSHKTALPIKNLYKTPKTLGKDRVAAAVGAFHLYPQESCLIIDAGTCITYDILDSKGVYHGGNIAPGIELRFKAMNAFTAKLPLVKRQKQQNLIGNTTVRAIRSGGQLGAIFEMEGFINSYKRQFGEINVILTGGDAKFFANKLKNKIFVHSNLVLIGLNKILNYNVRLLE